LSLSTLLNQVSALEEILDQLTEQTPANVYASAYKSVVLISTSIGQGSGFLFENKNTIITNYHVVESATDIDIQYFDGSRTYANIIGSDPYSDLAVLQVSMAPDESEPLFLSNESVVIGQQVVAIGNPFGSTDSLTAGYISQLNRLIDLYPLIIPVYQLDLTITFGNSGGPLLDLSGNVIGITNAGTYFGLNYAIPLEIINRVVPSLINEGEYQHPFVGVSLIGLTPDLITYFNISNLNRNQNGLLVADVFSGYPAEEAGLNPVIFEEYGIIAVDIILAVDGVPLFTIEDWVAYVETQISADETITLTVWRSGEIISIEVTTTQRPPP
jgi:S1-C subfamily serine protease